MWNHGCRPCVGGFKLYYVLFRPDTSPKGPSIGLLSRLEAEQSSLFRFRTSHMQVNPDNSVSPRKCATSSHDALPTPPSDQTSTSISTLRSSSSFPALKQSLNGHLSLSRTPSTGGTPSSSTAASMSNGSKSAAWTDAEASRISGLLAKHLNSTYGSVIDKETSRKIQQRALSKVLLWRLSRNILNSKCWWWFNQMFVESLQAHAFVSWTWKYALGLMRLIVELNSQSSL